MGAKKAIGGERARVGWRPNPTRAKALNAFGGLGRDTFGIKQPREPRAKALDA